MNKLLQLAKTNLVMLFNAASLIGTTAITSILGFAYWWVAARLFPQTAIGLASAMISIMSFLGTIAMLGLGTLLTGELPRQAGKEWSLINGALIVVGSAGIVTGIIFAFLAPLISPDLDSVGESFPNVAFFALGVGFTALTLVLDQALIGILRGGLQLWRNTLFSAIKLAALFAAAFLASRGAGMAIYVTWLIGNVLSLVVLFFGQRSQPSAHEIHTPETLSASGPLTGIEKSIKLPCPDCGTLSSNSASFCLGCGYPFSPTLEMASVRPQLLFDYGITGLAVTSMPRKRKYVTGNLCPDCGDAAPDHAHFCASCGYPLTPTVELASIKLSTPQLASKPGRNTLPLMAAVKREDTELPAKPENRLPARFEKARMALADDSSRLFAITLREAQPPVEVKHTPLPVEAEQALILPSVTDTPLPAEAEQLLVLPPTADAALPLAKEQALAAPGKKKKKNSYLPQWDLLRKLSGAAIQHHILNLMLLAPSQILPILVTILISTQATAQFYVSFMLANFIFGLTYALSTVLYAVSAAQPSVLAQKTRFTLGLSFITSLGANLVLQLAAGLLLNFFGHTYALQAAGCLRVLSLAVFPIIVKSHYIAICRVQDRVTRIMLPIAIGSALELSGAALGGHLAGLVGVSFGWFAVLLLEALYMSYTVYRAAYPINANIRISKT